MPKCFPCFRMLIITPFESVACAKKLDVGSPGEPSPAWSQITDLGSWRSLGLACLVRGGHPDPRVIPRELRRHNAHIANWGSVPRFLKGAGTPLRLTRGQPVGLRGRQNPFITTGRP